MSDSDRLLIIRGDDVAMTLQLTDIDDIAIDLTDCVVFFTAKRRKDDTDDDAAIKIDVDEHTDPTAGETRIVIPKETTQTLRLGDYYWDIQIKYPDGKIQSAVYEILTVIPQITERTEITS